MRLPSLLSRSILGNSPDRLYFSAKASYCIFNCFEIFFRCGKSASSKMRLSFEKLRNELSLNIFLLNWIQGMHQSEPANIKSIGLPEPFDKLKASVGSVSTCASVCNAQPISSKTNNLYIHTNISSSDYCTEDPKYSWQAYNRVCVFSKIFES